MAPQFRTIKVARDQDLRSQIGKDNHYFDLVDFTRIGGFKVPHSMTICSFKGVLTEEFGIPVQCQRLWCWTRRLNKTYRVLGPLTSEEEKLSARRLISALNCEDGHLELFLEVLHFFSAPTLIEEDDVLLFLKLYDPEQTQLQYVGTLSVKPSSMPSDILPKLRSLAGFSAHEEIDLYEEIKFEPRVLCEAVNIHRTFSAGEIIPGDIICYQKSTKSLNWCKYPHVASFLEHVLDQKQEQRKTNDLEEEILALKRQAHTDCLKKEEAIIACDQLKHERDYLNRERDNAVRQADELRDQNTHAILRFSPKDLEQATEHFSDAGKVGDTDYGHTYKSIIHNTMVAIKLSSSQSSFQQEVSIIRKWRHPNIVTLIGVCSETPALVYEWLHNGNLEDRIVCTNDSPPLSWQIRTQIIGEICCVLLFLHSNKPSALIHGDLRPCNILIDANYRSKLYNFGMSNLFLQPGTCPPNLTARLPYMDPEFNTTGELTPLSDVYSLGIIILRLLTGMSPLTLPKKVAEALKSDSLHLLIDKSAGDWPYMQAKQLALLGLSCVEMTREKRPDLLTKVWTVVEPLIRKPPAVSWPYFQSAPGGSCTSAPPDHFICPILKEIMKDPQVASDGFTYEAEAIRRWLDGGNSRSPMTNLVLPNRDLIPNHALRSSIQEYIQQRRQSDS